MNFEQDFTAKLGVFGRVGWSDGRNESFAYTEDDRTRRDRAFLEGRRVAASRTTARAWCSSPTGSLRLTNSILGIGGLGFLLGDGALTPGPEKIFEGFYTAHLWRGFFVSFDFQHINNPGYNKARGPIFVPGLRFHVDF